MNEREEAVIVRVAQRKNQRRLRKIKKEEIGGRKDEEEYRPYDCIWD
jgi:hypothetical protein